MGRQDAIGFVGGHITAFAFFEHQLADFHAIITDDTQGAGIRAARDGGGDSRRVVVVLLIIEGKQYGGECVAHRNAEANLFGNGVGLRAIRCHGGLPDDLYAVVRNVRILEDVPLEAVLGNDGYGIVLHLRLAVGKRTRGHAI